VSRLTPHDVKDLTHPVFAHHLVLMTDASVREVSVGTIIDETLEASEVPGADGTAVFK
jgi:MoxR-like ATPase